MNSNRQSCSAPSLAGLESGTVAAVVQVPRRRPSIGVWVLAVLSFYTLWLAYVWTEGKVQTVMENWPIALGMSLGSYAAGATPVGGGTVGFPVLVLLLGHAPDVGRDFSFAIQSVGMTSASLLILCRRQPLHWASLRPALWATLVGTPVGVLVIAPWMPELVVKATFAVMVAAFGVLHIYRSEYFTRPVAAAPQRPSLERSLGITVGLGASLFVSSVTGVGIDMLLYVALVLICRVDLRIAIPSSVLLMAATSLVGVAARWLTGTLNPEVGPLWLAAAPVVVVGAPLGAWAVDRVGRTLTLSLVFGLCLIQFIWMLYHERLALGASGIGAALAALVALNLTFEFLTRLGLREGRQGDSEASEPSV